ncbi:MAG TPA: MFS transporter [Streptosporangiaceae bacterium]|nr:MFS transporter [Streptosporangiaceae bacterium]
MRTHPEPSPDARQQPAASPPAQSARGHALSAAAERAIIPSARRSRPRQRSTLLRRAPVSAAVLAALAVEFADELVDGTKSAALPLLRDGLGLSYAQIGLLAAVPLIAGSLIELPMGVLAGEGRRRHRIAVLGGLAFILALVIAAAAQSFGVLLAALVLFFPASGAFVSLTQAALMDAAPGRREQLMARWTLAGALGAVAGPLLLAAVVAAGGTWRTAFLVLAMVSAAAWTALVATGARLAAQPEAILPEPDSAEPAGAVAGAEGPEVTEPGGAGLKNAEPGGAELAAAGADGAGPQSAEPGAARLASAEAGGAESGGAEVAVTWQARVRRARRALRDRSVLRWLILLEVSDLLLDAFTGFVALYLVAVAGVSPAQAALAVGVRLAADLAGTAVLIPVLERVRGHALLRASAAAALVLYPAFLLVPGFWPKVIILSVLSLVTAAWYPVLQAQLYASLPGQSGTAVSLLSAAGLAGGLGPLTVGFLAGQLGLGWALGLLAVVPAVILAGSGSGWGGGRRRD